MSTSLRARPTIYKGVQMRSRFEAGFAAWLDRQGHAWEYEPFAVGDEHGQYLPDFVIRNGFQMAGEVGAADAYVELKPTREAVDPDRLTRAAGQLESAVNAICLWLLVPGDPPVACLPQGFNRGAWVNGASDRLVLTYCFGEAPFERDWWT